MKTFATILFLLLASGVSFDAGAFTREMRNGAEEISLRSEGRVRLKFFAGGVMGNDKSVLRKIRIGQLHGGAFIAGSLEEILPGINILSLPLIFRSYNEVDYVRRQMDEVLKGDLGFFEKLIIF